MNSAERYEWLKKEWHNKYGLLHKHQELTGLSGHTASEGLKDNLIQLSIAMSLIELQNTVQDTINVQHERYQHG